MFIHVCNIGNGENKRESFDSEIDEFAHVWRNVHEFFVVIRIWRIEGALAEVVRLECIRGQEVALLKVAKQNCHNVIGEVCLR